MQNKFLIVLVSVTFLFIGESQITLASQTPADIPANSFAALADFENPKLSPSGGSVGYITTEKGRSLLMVQPLGGGSAYAIPPQPKSEILNFYWANENTVLLELVLTLNRREFIGKTTETRIFAYDLNTKKATWLGKPKNQGIGSSTVKESASQHEVVLNFLPDQPKHILMRFDFQLDGSPAIYKVSLSTGKRRVVKTGNDGIQNWMADQQGTVRLGTGYKRRGGYRAIFQDENGKWKNLENIDWYKKYRVVGFTVDPSIVFVEGASQYGTDGLFKLSLNTGTIIETLFVHETLDFDHAITDRETGLVIGAMYNDDLERAVYFDADYKALQASLDGAFPGASNIVVERSSTARRFLIKTSTPQNPGSYYLFDQATGKFRALANKMEAISPQLMAPSKMVSIPVRDGTSIPAVLTLPQNTDTSKSIPFVVLVHGGPSGQDIANWDYEAQFYASRGYGVLQPNFRGSTGYGRKFRRAGVRQWGGLMQDDVTDATNWLISENIADGSRICIAGSSYGGYAAMMGAILEPDLYQCAISVNGAPDLPRLKEADLSTLGGSSWGKSRGLNGKKDKEVSPYHRAKEITVPMLLIAAKDDARIPYQHTKDMHKRLKKLGKDSRYVQLKNGTHYMVTAEARLKVLRETEKFLAKHIGD
ncbi:MAG: hypothetical protein COB37_05260 [Kordiimonadales bacterium]|nr:MAG: hypothetical protein COB37_05260 [Kordiimonadales bacterium]